MKYLAVVGSRDYPRLDLVRQFVAARQPDTVIVSGGARGVDQAAVAEAERLGRQTLVFPADWSKGRGAGFARNRFIVDHADGLVAFWDGQSKGTAHTLELARESGMPVWVFGSDGELM